MGSEYILPWMICCLLPDTWRPYTWLHLFTILSLQFWRSPSTANTKPDFFFLDYVPVDTPLWPIVPLLPNAFSPYLDKALVMPGPIKNYISSGLFHATPCRITLTFHIHWPLLPYCLVYRCACSDPTLDSDLLESSELCHLFLEPQCLTHCWEEKLLNRYLLIGHNLCQNQYFSSSWIVIKKESKALTCPVIWNKTSSPLWISVSLAIKWRDASEISSCSKILRFSVTCKTVMAHKWNEEMGGTWREKAWFWGSGPWFGRKEREGGRKDKLMWSKDGI